MKSGDKICVKEEILGFQAVHVLGFKLTVIPVEPLHLKMVVLAGETYS